MLRREHLRSTSILMPMRVLMSETLSAPSASTARAISAMSVTLGESFTMSVLSYTCRTARTTLAAPSQVTPNAMPPLFTLGQEMFSSMPGMAGSAAMRAAQAA